MQELWMCLEYKMCPEGRLSARPLSEWWAVARERHAAYGDDLALDPFQALRERACPGCGTPLTRQKTSAPRGAASLSGRQHDEGEG